MVLQWWRRIPSGRDLQIGIGPALAGLACLSFPVGMENDDATVQQVVRAYFRLVQYVGCFGLRIVANKLQAERTRCAVVEYLLREHLAATAGVMPSICRLAPSCFLQAPTAM